MKRPAPYIVVWMDGATPEQLDAMLDRVASVAYTTEPEGVTVTVGATGNPAVHPLVPKPIYTATATRETDWWVLAVEGIGATQARSLRRAKSAVRDMISAALEIEKGSFHVVIDRRAEEP